MSYIPYGKQNISDDDINAVVEVLKSDFITQGPAIERFENTVADYCGVKHAVAVSNATAGLHIGALALGLKPGGLLWTSPNTFVASANCARYCSADVDFVDIDPVTYNICINTLKTKLEKAEKNGRLPGVLVPVHFSGQSCEMKEINQLAKQYGFKVMEDAAHAIGGKYQGTPIGACEFSDLAVFSFHPVKIITTAEGGLVTTNNDELASKLRLLRSHGVTRDDNLMKASAIDPNKNNLNDAGAWYYQQLELGLNYRMTDLQAALGASQMSRLDKFVEKRHQLAKRYDNLLSNLPVSTPKQRENTYSALHLYVIQLNNPEQHQAVFDHMRQEGIGVNLHYIPVHTQPYYQALGFNWGDYPNAENYYRRAISLPLFYDLSEEQQDRVVSVLSDALKKTPATAQQ